MRLNGFRNRTSSFLHSGDLGDVIYSMPSIKALGGGVVYLVSCRHLKPFTRARVDAITPLLLDQSYIEDVVIGSIPADYDFSTFRIGGHPYGVPLSVLQARWVRAPDPEDSGTHPWLSAPVVSSESKARIVVHRSARYQNYTFPWRQIAAFYGDRLLCLGLPAEHYELQKICERSIEYKATCDFVELASLIAGSDLFIGNQSSPLAVALGLGVPIIQETCIMVPDCILQRSNVQYVYNGEVVLSALGQGGGDLFIEAPKPKREIDFLCAPPGGWRVRTEAGARFMSLSFSEAVNSLAHSDGLSRAEAGNRIVDQLLERLPDYGFHEINPLFERTAEVIERLTKAKKS